MRKTIALLLSMSIAGAAFTGCGSAESATEEATTTATEKQTEAVTIVTTTETPTTVELTTESPTEYYAPVEIDTSKLVDIDPLQIKMDDFINNYNVIMPALFKDKFEKNNLSTDLLLITEEKYSKPFIKHVTSHHYELCDGLIDICLNEDERAPGFLLSCSIMFNKSDNNINVKTDNADIIFSNEKLVTEIFIATGFAVPYSVYSLEEIDSLIDDSNKRGEYYHKFEKEDVWNTAPTVILGTGKDYENLYVDVWGLGFSKTDGSVVYP